MTNYRLTNYAVCDLEQPSLFDLRASMDADPDNIQRNRDNARDWQKISRTGRMGINFAEASVYLTALGNYALNSQNLSDEANLSYSAAIGLIGLAFSAANGIVGSRRGFKWAEQEYRRRADVLEQRIGVNEDE